MKKILSLLIIFYSFSAYADFRDETSTSRLTINNEGSTSNDDITKKLNERLAEKRIFIKKTHDKIQQNGEKTFSVEDLQKFDQINCDIFHLLGSLKIYETQKQAIDPTHSNNFSQMLEFLMNQTLMDISNPKVCSIQPHEESL